MVLETQKMLRVFLFFMASLCAQASGPLLENPQCSFEFRASKLQEALRILEKRDPTSYTEFMKNLAPSTSSPFQSFREILRNIMTQNHCIQESPRDVEFFIYVMGSMGAFNIHACDPLHAYRNAKLFKIGFEFQDMNHLCPWGPKLNHAIHKKSIMHVQSKDGRVLWNLTIDWEDLEFVTEPFSSNEEEELLLAIQTIEIACQSLEKLSHDRQGQPVTFQEWHDYCAPKMPKGCTIYFNKDLWNQLSGAILQSKQGGEINVRFQPQVTIQHHLSDTIHLTMGLFSENLEKKKGGYKVSQPPNEQSGGLIKSANAVMENCFSCSESADVSFHSAPTPCFQYPTKTTKQSGFLFLHMLTCRDLVNYSFNNETEGINIMNEWTKSGQVNPKALIYVVSRRPFSSMWRDIKQDSLSYSKLVNQNVNQSFIKYLSEKFEKLNYGETYFGDREKMTVYAELKKQEIMEKGIMVSPRINKIEEQGVVSTSMLLAMPGLKVRNIFNHYFRDVVESVDQPSLAKRYVFDPYTVSVIAKNTDYDVLSPMHFVSDEDSMGAYKEDKHDKTYGEAIVEFRNITMISKRALTKIVPEATVANFVGEFLWKARSGASLQEQVKGLFLYIRSLLGGC